MDWESSRDEAERKAREREECERLRGVIDGLARSRDGLFFLRWLVAMSGVLETAYPADHASAAYREGRRSLGLHIMTLCPPCFCGALMNDEEVTDG